MKRVVLWCWLLVKRQLKTPAVVLFLLGLPLLSLLAVSMPAMQEEGVLRVGLVAEGADETAQKTMDRLIAGSYSAVFYDAQTRSVLEADILNGDAQHGYVFSGALTEKLDAGDLKGSILLLQERADLLPAMTKEIVFSELYRVYGLNIVLDFVGESELFSAIRTNALEMVRQKYEKYSSGPQTFHLDIEVLDDAGLTTAVEPAGAVFPIRGVLAVLIFVAGLYGGVWWKLEREEGLFTAMPYRLVQAGRFLYIGVPAVLFALSAELTLALTHTGNFPYELAQMAGYLVLVLLFTALLTVVLPDSRWMVSAIPVFAAASLVLCPVFVDLTAVIPGIRYVCRFLVPYYYI